METDALQLPASAREREAPLLHRINANSVTAYQVIELPRSPDDPPEGVLRLALGPDSHESWWQKGADYLDHVIERAEEYPVSTEIDPWQGLLTHW